MRIEAYNQISQLYNADKAGKVKSGTAVNKKDKLEISQKGRDYQVAKQAVAEAPDVREDIVAELKARIAAGSYEVSANDFAAKVIESYNKLML